MEDTPFANLAAVNLLCNEGDCDGMCESMHRCSEDLLSHRPRQNWRSTLRTTPTILKQLKKRGSLW